MWISAIVGLLGLAQLPGQTPPEGPLSFRAISSGSALPASGHGVRASAPVRAAMNGGSVLIYQFENKKCPPGTKLAGTKHVNILVLYLDDSEDSNQLIVDQRKSTAQITLRGLMDRWEPAADYCESGDFVKAASGRGSVTASFRTMSHLTPRTFTIAGVTGSVTGPGISESLTLMPNSPVAGSSVALEEYGEILQGNPAAEKMKPLLVATMGGTKIVDRAPTVIVQITTSSSADTLGLTIHKPDVLRGGPVSETDEESIGAQTFVNLDNDDRDDKFDIEDTSVQGDDELVKLVLKIIPKRSPGGGLGNCRLNVIEDSTSVKLWTTANKGAPFDATKAIRVPEDFQRDGNALKKEIWVEGTQAHSKQRATRFEFMYSEIPDFKDAACLTVIGIEKLEWKGEKNSENDDDVLTEDPNYGTPNAAFGGIDTTALRIIPLLDGLKAYRVFPGARFVDGKPERQPRKFVRLEATLSVTPTEPIPVQFESFDVDDTWSMTQLLDPERAAEDNRGAVAGPNPKAGRFIAEKPDGIKEAVFSAKSVSVAFEVTMQPGDNFRVVANGDRKFLLDLHNNDNELGTGPASRWNTDKQLIVNPYVLKANPRSPKDAEVLHPNSYVSPTLTVWRRMYVEVDRMDVVADNNVEGHIVKLFPNDPAPGFTRVVLDKNISSEMDVWPLGMQDSFEGGKLKIGRGEFPVTNNTANYWKADEVTVRGSVPSTAVGMIYELQDDDVRHGFEEGDPLPPLDTRTVADRYLPAYIVPDFTTLEATNLTKVAPFKAHVFGVSAKHLRPLFRFDHIAHEANPTAWCVYLLAAFECVALQDGDPMQEFKTGGIVDEVGAGQGALIFLEGLNELSGADNGGIRKATTPLGQGEQDSIAHELAHLLGADHPDGGIMDQVSDRFTEVSLAKMRSIKNP